MLEIVPPGVYIDFLGKAKLGIALSILVILIGLSAIVWRGGVKQGIDFSGGTLLQLRLSQPADLGTVREALEAVGWERAIVQHYFAFALLVGMIAGTYSTIFLANPLLVYGFAWRVARATKSVMGAVNLP